MGSPADRAPRHSLAPLALLFAALVVAACGGSAGGLGLEAAPASLDPDSPLLIASNGRFDVADVDVPANAAFTLVFENRDTDGHNVSIYADGSYSTRLFQGVVFSSSTRWYPVPSLAPGTYVFKCDLHPDMNGRVHAG